jgi:mono/diheme cytochrome c family protein
LAFGAPTLASVPHDPGVARGEHIARMVCAACHTVASDQETPPMLKRPAPDFREVANRPDVTADSVQEFVTHTHRNIQSLPMSTPDPKLSEDEARAVALYIMSLRKP